MSLFNRASALRAHIERTHILPIYRLESVSYARVATSNLAEAAPIILAARRVLESL